MTNNEFSNEFDVFYNNITSNQAPGLNQYEKSVFLTEGQDDVLRAYFNPRENKPQQGFDDSRKRQIDFSALMKTATLSVAPTDTKFDSRSISYRMPQDLLLFVNEACKDNKYRYVVLPISYEEYDRLMLKPYQYPIKRGVWRLIVDSTTPTTATREFEAGYSLGGTNSSNKEVLFVVTTTSDNIETVFSSGGYAVSAEGIGKAPTITETSDRVTIECVVSRSLKRTVDYWSMFLTGTDYAPGITLPWLNKLHMYIGDRFDFPNIDASTFTKISVLVPPATPFIELIGKVDRDSLTYTVRYLRRPRPIILEDLTDDNLSIRGVATESTCELDESLHQEILQRAVELAKAAYMGDLQSQIALGQASKTDIGAVAQSR